MVKEKIISLPEKHSNKDILFQVTLLLPLSGGNYDIPSIVRQRSQRSLIHYVPGIKRVFVVEKDDGLLLRTEGVNVFVSGLKSGMKHTLSCILDVI